MWGGGLWDQAARSVRWSLDRSLRFRVDCLLVAFAPVRVLFLSAKHLFYSAKARGCACGSLSREA